MWKIFETCRKRCDGEVWVAGEVEGQGGVGWRLRVIGESLGCEKRGSMKVEMKNEVKRLFPKKS